MCGRVKRLGSSVGWYVCVVKKTQLFTVLLTKNITKSFVMLGFAIAILQKTLLSRKSLES